MNCRPDDADIYTLVTVGTLVLVKNMKPSSPYYRNIPGMRVEYF